MRSKKKQKSLGAIYTESATVFRVWSEGRESIDLLLFRESSKAEPEVYRMYPDEEGIYEVCVEGDLVGSFYRYRIDDSWEVTDPYSFSSAINSSASAIIDMTRTNPEGWEEHRIPLNLQSEAIIYEMNVKNFTADISSGVDRRGKFLGLTEKHTKCLGCPTGLDHLKDLGITHVQLMPIYDFVSVDEEPGRFFDDDNYNWGYDPELYNVVEGSYATDPWDPNVRIRECKSMIMALHEAGISVIMDVVYNHTYKSYDSNLNLLAPGYYYRMSEDGSFSNGSGVGNEIATERRMARKLVVDSLCFWAKEFKVDGFRMDLMALIDTDTVDLALKRLREINPNILVYGEPWTALSTPLPIERMTVFGSQSGKGYGLFNSQFREAMKGDNDGTRKGFVQGNYNYKNAVECGIVGSVHYDENHQGILSSPSESINYFNCHDNLILQDKLMLTVEERKHMLPTTKLAFSILLCAQGIPLFYEGNEFMHSKNGVANSYKSPLSVNAIDWKDKVVHRDLNLYVKELIAYRKEHSKVFNLPDEEAVKENLKFLYGLDYSVIGYILSIAEDEWLMIFHNANFFEKEIRQDVWATPHGETAELKVVKEFDSEGRCDVPVTEILLEPLSTQIYRVRKERLRMNYKKIYESWVTDEHYDQETRDELIAIAEDPVEIKERFYTELKFGTAGLRGKIGAGTNRMNRYTVAKATQGLAMTIAKRGEEAKARGVAIAYDVRHKSKEFAKVTASVLAANGIKVYLFEDIRPTPVLSYAIRKLKTISGVMVTASHNPRDYNGYKAYWEEGSQILEDIADEIFENIGTLKEHSDIKEMSFDEAVDQGMVEYIGDEIDQEYLKDVLDLALSEDIDKEIGVVYSPLNGTGNVLVQEVLKRRGFSNVSIVKEQELPDPDFTTANYPNPEDPKAFEYSIALGKELGSDLLIATDPDADRVAMVIRDRNGEFVFFNGNKIGALLVNYILERRQEQGKIPNNAVIVKSIVTGDLSTAICEKYSVEMVETLTGFKNICGKANEYEKTGEKAFLFGYEESIGYNYGTFVRDKDAVSSSMMIVEMVAYYKKRGKNMIEVLEELYREFGYYKDALVSITLEGADGQEKIRRIMEEFRNRPMETAGDLKVVKIIDYSKPGTGLPLSDVLKYYFNDRSWAALRPSGTEPKIKLYMSTKGVTEEESLGKLAVIEEKAREKMNGVK